MASVLNEPYFHDEQAAFRALEAHRMAGGEADLPALRRGGQNK